MFGLFGVFFVSIGVGSIVSSILWSPGFSRKREHLILLIFLICIAPFSAINIAARDRLISYEAQTLLDFVLVVFGVSMIVYVSRMVRASSYVISKALGAVAIFLISVLLVILPGFYGTVYLLTLFGAIERGADFPDWIEPMATLVGLIVAVATLIREWGAPPKAESE